MSAEVVVIGGGIIGTTVALALRDGGAGRVVLVERDPGFTRASTTLALGAVRQLFTTPANLALASRSIALLRQLDATLGQQGHAGRIGFRQVGTLILATHASRLRIARKADLLAASGAVVEYLDREALVHRLPGLNLDDVVGGFFGAADGILDPRAMLAAYGTFCDQRGVERVRGEVSAIHVTKGRVAGVGLRDDRRIDCAAVVCAAGAFSAAVGRMAGLDVPVTPVRQQLTRCELPPGERFDLPMVVTPQGVFWRYEAPPGPRASARVVCGYVNRAEPPGERFDYDEAVWSLELAPVLARYMPSYRRARVLEGWAGLYEMTPDGNQLLGEHPELRGFWLACGFSGHGIMLAPAAAETLAALMLGHAPDIDVSAFAPGRFARGTLTRDEPIL